tara:strand:+ start:40827 stop:41183 length:357 start_codon:yes stop_codon:yes gene_type:complete
MGYIMAKKISFDGLIIPVLGKDCKVIELEKLEDDNAGNFCGENFQIELLESLSLEKKINTLAHELGHATLERLGIHLDPLVEETVINNVANVFTEAFDVDPIILIERFGDKKKTRQRK